MTECVKRVMVVYTRSFDSFDVCCFKQLGSCRGNQLINHTVPRQVVGRILVSSANSFGQ